MTPARWATICSVYDAVDVATGPDRPALLERLCGGDIELRKVVESLFTREETGDPIALAIGEAATHYLERDFASALAQPGERVGRYEIVRLIGRGGMGAVFEATRVDDFRKRVALKVIRGELDSDVSRRRFEQERQLLANLEHPYVARLIDGGETAQGSPYLVLEYVEGEAFLDHCARLNRVEVLRLFVKVCQAVEHAHRNLIIHRDLKPSNILVTADGDPKLLDFGIATLVQPDGPVQALEAVTLRYASPEALQGRPMSTATDVYSLGVILFRLLTGSMPDRPSAAHDQIHGHSEITIPPGLGDELGAITAMALRNDPEQRYGRARDLSDEIERYLAHLPIRAHPNTIVYRARKFMRRRWLPLIAATALGLTAALGVAATLHQADVAQRRFGQLRSLAHSFVFDYGDDLANIEGTTAVREHMVGAALHYLDGLSQDAGNDVHLQRELAAAYAKIGDSQGNPAGANLGHVDAALASYAKAARLYDRVVAADEAAAGEAGEFYVDYAKLLILANKPAAAEKANAQAFHNLGLAQKAAPGDPDNLARISRAWCILGDAAQSPPLQLAEYHRCNRIAEMLLQVRPGWASEKIHIGTLIREAGDMGDVGHMDQAVLGLITEQNLLDAALATHPLDPELRKRQTMLAQLRSQLAYNDMGPSLGDPAASVLFARQYVDLARRAVARDPSNAAARFSLAVGLFRLSFPLKYSDPAGAIASARDSVRDFQAIIAQGKASPLVVSRQARAKRRLGEALLFSGKVDEAAVWIGRALADHEREAAATPSDFDENANLIIALIDAAHIADAAHHGGAAVAHLSRAEAMAVSLVAADKRNLPAVLLVSRTRSELADHYRRAGDTADAAAWRLSARQVWQAFPEQNSYIRKMAASGIALPH